MDTVGISSAHKHARTKSSLLAIKTFVRKQNMHILIRLDNRSAVSYMNRERRNILKTTVRSGVLLLELVSEQEPNYLGRTHYIQYPDRSGIKSLP